MFFLYAMLSVIGDKVDIQLHYSEYFMGGGFFCPFCPRGQGGVCRMSTLVHSRGEGVKIGSKLVHVRSC